MISGPRQSEDTNHVPNDTQKLPCKPRVLLADDCEAFLHLAHEILKRQFEVVALAHDGAEYLELAEKCSPDACVVDISMPCMSGIEASRRLLEKTPGARIVFLTMHDDPAYRDAAVALGARGYVLKRSLDTDLIPALHAALANNQVLPSRVR